MAINNNIERKKERKNIIDCQQILYYKQHIFFILF